MGRRDFRLSWFCNFRCRTYGWFRWFLSGTYVVDVLLAYILVLDLAFWQMDILKQVLLTALIMYLTIMIAHELSKVGWAEARSPTIQIIKMLSHFKVVP